MIGRFLILAFNTVLVSLIALVGVSSSQEMNVTRVATGLSRPVFATTAPGDNSRMFIVEQHTGDIEILNTTTGTINATPFLNVGGITSGNEQGLLGLAFHPDYQTNGMFYVNFTNSAGDTIVREYGRQTADLADAGSARQILTFDQPFANHNGGWLGFGPNGYLHVATGDGGSGGDPFNNAQDITDNLLGKILRIDINGDDFAADPNRNYAVPSNNPFVGVTGDDEIWAYGLRNPWRASFDRDTNDFWIGDVGQGAKEEIDFQFAFSAGGENYGWRVREGASGGTLAGAIDPIYDYDHGSGDDEGFSVTGGYVYRGPIAELQGHYFFADYVTDRIWSIKFDGSDPADFDGTNYTDFIDWTDFITTDAGTLVNVSSFGEDELGNLYIVDLGGEVYRVDFATIPEPTTTGILVLLGTLLLRRRRFRTER